jgi:hypothetical protein
VSSVTGSFSGNRQFEPYCRLTTGPLEDNLWARNRSYEA